MKHYIGRREDGSRDVTTGEHLFDAAKKLHRAARKGLHRYDAISEAAADAPAVVAFLAAEARARELGEAAPDVVSAGTE